jgi:hypothetical protein
VGEKVIRDKIGKKIVDGLREFHRIYRQGGCSHYIALKAFF